MKRLIAISILVLLPYTVSAQFSLTYAPKSVKAWGDTPSAEMYAFSYGFDAAGHPMEIGIMHIRHNNPNVTDNIMEPISIWALMSGETPTGAHLVDQVTGLYFLPFIWEHSIKKYATVSFSVGGIYFDKATPTKNAKQFNLLFRLRIDIPIYERIGVALSYQHISNAFTGRINPGTDLPGISITYNIW